MPKLFDPRPSRANPEARAARKKLEKESPHISMSEVAMKGGALALLTAVALFPWEKEFQKHERTHHPERFEDAGDPKNKNRVEDGDRRRSRRDDRDEGDSGSGGNDEDGRRGRRDGDRRRRRQSEGGEREREYRTFLDRDREYRPLPVEVAPSSAGGRDDRYTGSDDGEYGRRYVEASRMEKERRERSRGRVDYEYSKGGWDEGRR